MNDNLTDSQFAMVLLPLALAAPYTYLVPPGMAVAAGDYVQVPLGPRAITGVVWKVLAKNPDPGIKLRAVRKVFDLPGMAQMHRDFVDWIAEYYLQPAGSVLRMCLRAPGIFEPPGRKFAYRLSGTEPARMTPQRRKVLDTAARAPSWRSGDLALEAGCGTSVVKGLIAAGALLPVELPAFDTFETPSIGSILVKLSRSQEAAAGRMRALAAVRGFGVALLDGVTGSGKTEVYFEAMAAALSAGRQVLLLLPEIALTGQFLARVEERFGACPAQWHSGIRPRERERVWRAVASGEARLVVAARSGLMLPWQNPGLSVVDEEHEPAYKQEDGVPYHARDMAVVYGVLGKFPVVLASATPSLESLVNVDRGRYDLISLKDRHGAAELPEVSLIDMRQSRPAAGRWLCDELADAVAGALGRGEQAMLFLNRRGYAPLTLCRDCGHRFECPDCSAWLVEHRFRRQLMCHHCGHGQPVPSQCPQCKSRDALTACGPGVERLAEEAAQRFPDAKMIMLSSDHLRGQRLSDTIGEITRGEYDLIIGTQLVAKGHNFKHLTLVGVVDADLALETSDPRAGERTWQLLAQVAGRAGRGDKPGRALIQTYMPEHPLMAAMAGGARDEFLDQEKRMRKLSQMPPYSRLVALIISGKDAVETERFARGLVARAPLPVLQDNAVRVFGPAPAALAVIRGRYRWRVLIRAPRSVDIQRILRQWLGGIVPKGSLRLYVDVDPYSFL